MRIGIIGGGFTGAMLAVQLLRLGKSGLDIALIEGAHPFGRGVAYDSHNPDHLLNVRVANMSAYEDDPSHFLRWLWARDTDAFKHIPPSGHGFVSRRIYGDYVADVLRAAVAMRPRGVSFTVHRQVATALHRGKRLIVRLADGRRLYLDHVALCLGNFAPTLPPALRSAGGPEGRIIANPWDESRLRRIPANEPVLVIGSGLTMVDVVQTLMRRGHRGAVRVVSRRGLTPQRHELVRAYCLPPPEGGLRPAVRTVRSAIRTAAADGYGWRDVIDALRPMTSTLWQRFSLAERRQFLRHLRPYWEIHRHRLAPQVADALEDWQRSGKLAITAGTLKEAIWTGASFAISIAPRGHGAPRLAEAAWIINCSGPQTDYAQIAHPLVRRLMESGAIRPDALRLGIDVTPENAVIAGDGAISSDLYALGPPTKGAFWEITAVPDIRAACARVARTLLASAPASAGEPVLL